MPEQSPRSWTERVDSAPDPFERLLKDVQVGMYIDLRKRLGMPPKCANFAEWKYRPPGEAELELGTFVEALQPQFRAAVLIFKRKGYGTYSSGFSMGNYAEQHIVGHFPAHPELIKRLNQIGIRYEPSEPANILAMDASLADITDNEQRWRAAAIAFPDLHRPAPAPYIEGHEEFRQLYREGRLRDDFLPLWLYDYHAMYGPNEQLNAAQRFDGYEPHLTPEVERKTIQAALQDMRFRW